MAVAALSVLAVYAVLALRTFVSVDIAQMIRVTDRLASGELMDNVQGFAAGTRDAARMWESILKMNTTLAGIVKQVRSSADAVVAGSHTIAEGNAQLAQRTQEQAVSLEETVSGMEHLAAQRAPERRRLRAGEPAGRPLARSRGAGVRRMQQLADTMRSIDASARRVGDILGTVEASPSRPTSWR